MTMSGSTSCTNARHAINILSSLSKASTCDPTMCEHVLRVKTFRMNGLLSPRSWETWSTDGHLQGRMRFNSPCLVTMFAIWITGSTSASGKIPLRPAHSISKLRILSGASVDHSPSGAWEINAFQLRLTFSRRQLPIYKKYSLHAEL